nr:1-deoxy-D-xylulose-5-phosphate synthase [Flavobacterium sp.]
AFGTGHSSTSISAALGMALASALNGFPDRTHIAVIGDASIASGMAFEALNHAGVTDANLLIILNDNAIGIDPSVGALKNYFTAIKSGEYADQYNWISSLNIDYSGPIDGHDLPAVIAELRRLQTLKGPRFLHLITTKGKGLQQAEDNQVTYHAPGKFNAQTGELNPKDSLIQPPKFQDVFGLSLVELAESNPKIIGITPAMPTGSSLKYMMDAFPDRAFDVGIAEQHAVTLAAGMATQGMVVFCAIYSTFLQRAYDQLIHDVALQNLPVIFCVDRAGLVGEDGATHHGVFDIAYLRCIPNMIVCAPRNEIELRNLLYTAQLGLKHPMAIRYPRGRGSEINWQQPFSVMPIGKAELLKAGQSVAVLTTGSMAQNATDAIALSKNQAAIAHYSFTFIKPLDEATLHEIFQKYRVIITLEDGTTLGGFGSAVAEFASAQLYPNTLKIVGIPDEFIMQGTVEEVQQYSKLDAKNLQILFDNYTNC